MKNIAIIENNIIAVHSIREKLIRTFLDKGYGVTVLTSGPQAQMQAAKDKGVNVIDVGSSRRNPFFILRYQCKLYNTLRRLKPDVCLTFTIRPAIWGNIITRMLKIPTITNITGIGPLFARNNITYRGARVLYRFALRKTAKIFFQNNDDMEIFVKKGLATAGVSERIPGSGVDHERFAPREKRKSAGEFNYIFISRLVKDKGIAEYVAAARILKNEIPSAVFSVLGPVWDQNLKDNTVTRSEIDEWVREGIVRYLGESDDIRDFVAEADCVVLPSYREGLSNVLLEAASMEKPCIASNVTGCKEVIEDGVTGFLCKVKDPADLAAKMKIMYQIPDAQRTAMGKSARKRVIREFDKGIVIDSYVKAIAQVLKI